MSCSEFYAHQLILQTRLLQPTAKNLLNRPNSTMGVISGGRVQWRSCMKINHYKPKSCASRRRNQQSGRVGKMGEVK